MPTDLDRAAAAAAVTAGASPTLPDRSTASPPTSGSCRGDAPAGGRGSALLSALPLRAQIDPATADRFAKLALACLDREYPNKPDAVLEDASDVKAPRDLHPAFYGCYDWHSSVHGHWMLVRLPRVPGHALGGRRPPALDQHLSAERSRRKRSTTTKPGAGPSSGRTAGPGRCGSPPISPRRTIRPRRVERALEAARGRDRRAFSRLPARSSRCRCGAASIRTPRSRSPGARLRARDRTRDFEKIVLSRASFYYGQDRACPLAYEPSGEDFFSPCLAEADLMRRVLPPRDYAKWLKRFLPQLTAHKAFPLRPLP